MSNILYTRQQEDCTSSIQDPAHGLTTCSEIQIPNCCDNINDDDRDIYSMVDKKYHREDVGENSEQAGNTVVKAMNGGATELSRIYPTTDFVDTVLEKIPFIRKLENDTIKKLNTDAVNSTRNQHISTVEPTTQISQFSPIGVTNNSLSMLDSQTQL